MNWILAEAIIIQLIFFQKNRVSKIVLKLHKQAIFAGSSMCLWLLRKKGLLYCENKLYRNVEINNF